MTGLLLPNTLPSEVARLLVEGCLRGRTDAIDNYDESRRSPNSWRGDARRRVRMVVWHITQGGLVSSLNWLTNPESEASSNDVISREGRVYNIVPGADAPWTNGPVCDHSGGHAIIAQAADRSINPNWWSYTIECVGMSRRGTAGSLTDAQTAALILRTAQACVEYKLSADSQHIVRHSHIDGCDRPHCPGYAQSEFVAWTGAVAAITGAWRGW
jgi:N-acetyl-anhydromuramyl-L-alanine amidase AmpD